ncbi:MAG: sulfite exporter TauE/SafE family protein [Bacteroidales bacterium]
MVLTLIILFAGALFAGFIGSLTGLGGGVVLVPLLTLGFGVDIRYAIGTSLISVIATSSGAASAYLKEGLLNVRIGMFLEIATTLGAIVGAAIAVFAPTHAIAVIFGLVLLYSAVDSFRKRKDAGDSINKPLENGWLMKFLRVEGYYNTGSEKKYYKMNNVAGGFLVMALAGILSGLLGIGSGALKVIAMDSVMKIPFKVSTSTSNFMIGVTAAASAGIYLNRGYIDPVLSMPVMIGVLLGSLIGAKILLKAQTKNIRIVFAFVIAMLAFEMIYNGLVKNI